MLQPLQLEALQLAQELPVPAVGVVPPSLALENEVKRENALLAICWHWGQEASSVALFMGRRSSNL